MTSADPPPDDNKSDKLMRAALLLALQREAKGDDDHMTTMLHLVARKLVDKAKDGDIQAIKEIFDRSDGKTLPGMAETDAEPVKRTVEWKDHPLLSTIGRGINSSRSTTEPSASPASSPTGGPARP
jgi:hypothetical protein